MQVVARSVEISADKLSINFLLLSIGYIEFENFNFLFEEKPMLELTLAVSTFETNVLMA